MLAVGFQQKGFNFCDRSTLCGLLKKKKKKKKEEKDKEEEEEENKKKRNKILAEDKERR